MRIIGGKYGRRRFEVPRSFKARPTTDFAKESLFMLIENRMDIDNCQALDLFAGTGSISFELLSREAAQVICIEQQEAHYRYILSIQEKLKDQNLIAIKSDAFKYLKTTHLKFDFIFADPPYALPNISEIVEYVIDRGLLNPEGWLVVEHSKETDLSHYHSFVEKRSYGSVNFSFFHLPDSL